MFSQMFMWGVSDAVKRMRPNAEFEITDTKFTKWKDSTGALPPSWDEIMNQVEIDKVEYDRLEYARNRVDHYPFIGEQLDMIWHAINTDKIPGKDSEWFKTIESIKQKYPKK